MKTRIWLENPRSCCASSQWKTQRLTQLTIAVSDGIITYTSWPKNFPERGGSMFQFVRSIWSDEQGQDIAEYAVMLAVILVLVIGTVRLIGTGANTAFSQVASSLTQ